MTDTVTVGQTDRQTDRHTDQKQYEDRKVVVVDDNDHNGDGDYSRVKNCSLCCC